MNLFKELVKQGVLDKKKATSLEYEAKTSNKKQEEIILEKNIISEESLFNLKSEFLKIPFKKDLPEKIPSEILKLISEESANFYNIIPFAKKNDILEIGMVYPENIQAGEALKFSARQGKFSYKIFLITLSDFNKLFKEYRTIKVEMKKALTELETELKTKEVEVQSKKTTEFESLTEDAPVIKIVAVILRQAVEGKASDIHIEPAKKELKIRFRLDGILHASLFLPLKIHPAVVARIKILSVLKIDETRIPQDGRFSAKIDGEDIDFRVSTFPTTLGEKIVIRVLKTTEGVKSLDSIGLTGRNLKVAQEGIKKTYGLILVTGPTGCGKSTTLYAMLQILNQEGVNIVTLEDPVEYFVEGVNQSQVRPEVGYDFASGLRHILRQDPDIIMIGEIRDAETASLAIHAALTGHLVLSTLHTTSALGVIPRLIDIGIESYLIPASLNLAIAQRLIRRLCPFCKKKIKPSKEVQDFISKEIDVPKSFYIYEVEEKGCKKCNFKGYSGRIGAIEILNMTDELSDIILKSPGESEIKKEAQRQGMTTMKQDGLLKVLEGITSLEEVLRVTEEK